MASQRDNPTSDITRLRLRQLMEERGLTATALARKANLGATFVYDIFSGKSSHIRPTNLTKLAGALKVNKKYLIEDGLELPAAQKRPAAKQKSRPRGLVKVKNATHVLPVIGVAESGSVKTSSFVALRRQEIICPPFERFPKARTAAVEIRDLSMDRASFPLVPGSYAAFAYFDDKVRPQHRMVALICINHGNGIETIIRRVHFEGGHFMLTAESSKPAQYPVIRLDALPTKPGAKIHALGKVYMGLGFFADETA